MIGSLLRRRGADRPGIEFAACAADCCITGRLRLTESRLSDMLNRRGEVSVSDAEVMVGAGPLLDSVDARAGHPAPSPTPTDLPEGPHR